MSTTDDRCARLVARPRAHSVQGCCSQSKSLHGSAPRYLGTPTRIISRRALHPPLSNVRPSVTARLRGVFLKASPVLNPWNALSSS